MTENGTEAPRRQTPTEFARELAMAVATKEPPGKSETLGYKTATTGVLAGTIWPDVNLSREDGETMYQWRKRARDFTRDLLKDCLVFNAPEYRDELLREALAELRNPEKVTT